MMVWIRQNWHRALAHAAGLAPLLILAIDYLRGELEEETQLTDFDCLFHDVDAEEVV